MTQSPGQQSLEQLAIDLVAIPSVIGDEAAVCDYCESWLRARKMHGLTRAGENLAFHPRPFREGVPKVLLLGHLDTVPKSDDNPARIEGDKLSGLGSSDMKCADALLMQLCARAVHEDAPVDLCGVLYAREEGPYDESGMPEILAAAPGCFQDVDFAVAMEPTDNRIELGCLGTMHARVTLRGKRAHSARPWHGENAIHMAAPLIGALAALAPRDAEFGGLLFREVCSATMIDFDGARNVIPGACTLNLNFRFAPDRDSDEAVAWLADFVRDALGDAVFREHVEFEVLDVCPSGRVCAKNPLLSSLREVAGPSVRTVAKQAWTDVGRLSQLGIDAINFGPGHTAQAHQRGEFASRALLGEAADVLHRWIFGSAPKDPIR